MTRADHDFPKLAQPALRALAGAGITHLAQLAGHRESEIAHLHGIGPNALEALREALSARGLTFQKEEPK
jgi:predicted flap endonuclease-1-like 5' DNA nuclease